MPIDDCSSTFGEALIGALEEAIAFENGNLPEPRIDRIDITAERQEKQE